MCSVLKLTCDCYEEDQRLTNQRRVRNEATTTDVNYGLKRDRLQEGQGASKCPVLTLSMLFRRKGNTQEDQGKYVSSKSLTQRTVETTRLRSKCRE